MRLASREVAAAFVHDVLARDGAVWVRERSESMGPLVRAGDRLHLVPIDPAHLEPGHLVAYRRGVELVVHRVLARHGDGVITKGDGLAHRDAAVAAHDVVGRVTAIATARGRRIDLDAGVWTWLGRLLTLCSRLSERTTPRGGALARLPWMLTRLPAHVVAWSAR
jgi:hypothetical protein